MPLTQYYRHIQIPERTIAALRSFITAQFSQLHAAVKQERNAHVLERDDLQAERSKLLQAHYAGAVPLDLLKSEQDRIGRRLAFLEAQIKAGDMEYELASAHLDDCLALARDCYTLYMSIDDSLRRIANQAFFDKLYLSEEGTVIGEPGEPFNAFFGPGVQTTAARHEGRAAESRSQTGNVAGLNNDLLVGLHRYFSNHNKPRRTLISRVIKGSRAMPSRSGSPRMADSRGPVRENSSQSQTRLSASNRVALLAGYAEGVPVQELATRFNIHRATVREIARRAGHPSRASEHSQQLRGEAARLYAEGFTLSQVAAQLGIGDEAVRSAVVANGGTIRPKGRRKMSAYF